MAVYGLELVGNVGATRRNAALKEAASHGLIFGGCRDVVVDGVTARHFAGDGLYIRHGRQPGPSGAHSASRSFNVRNSRFLFNARQGLSVIQLRGGRFENCDFSHTGYIAPERRGLYGSHGPAAGVDVEPNLSPNSPKRVDVMTGDLHFERCRMVGNRGATLLACKSGRQGPFIERISLQLCELRCDQSGPSRYGFIFDVPNGSVADCTLDMGSRTAFLGWRLRSDARFRFGSNEVHGRGFGPGRPLLHVVATAGAPVVEQNRFLVSQGTRLDPLGRKSIIQIDNPNAIVRDNQILAEP